MSKTYCKFLSLLLFTSVALTSVSVLADQTADELPGLFEQLRGADSSDEASRVEQLIWQHWLKAPDEQSAQLMHQISTSLSASDFAVALRLNDQLVERYPEYAEAWNKRATIHYLLGNNVQSVADIRETVALEPRHFGAISGLGLIFLREENFEAALDAFEKVLSISPASLSARRSIDRVRSELGREI